MNRKYTPILAAVAVLLAVAAFYSSRSRHADSPVTGRGQRILEVNASDMLQVHVQRDFWNSFVLARAPDGQWRLVDPSDEPAAPAAVDRLLRALEALPVVSVINLPSDDTERFRAYGLWEPALTVSVFAHDQEHSLLFGTETEDRRGVYCSLDGRNVVYVTTSEALQILSTDYEQYRLGAAP
jgi:hypothetical protein